MKSLRIQAAVGGLAVMAGLLLAACSPAKGSPPSQVPEGAMVSREPGGDEAITVTFSRAGDELLIQPGRGPDLSIMRGKVLAFTITLDTNAGDISKLELNEKVFIKDGYGVEMRGMVRQLTIATQHTMYAAAFPKLDSQGKALDDPSQKGLQIVIRGVGQVQERTLEWKP